MHSVFGFMKKLFTGSQPASGTSFPVPDQKAPLRRERSSREKKGVEAPGGRFLSRFDVWCLYRRGMLINRIRAQWGDRAVKWAMNKA